MLAHGRALGPGRGEDRGVPGEARQQQHAEGEDRPAIRHHLLHAKEDSVGGAQRLGDRTERAHGLRQQNHPSHPERGVPQPADGLRRAFL